jgi:hypothetical protein
MWRGGYVFNPWVVLAQMGAVQAAFYGSLGLTLFLLAGASMRAKKTDSGARRARAFASPAHPLSQKPSPLHHSTSPHLRRHHPPHVPPLQRGPPDRPVRVRPGRPGRQRPHHRRDGRRGRRDRAPLEKMPGLCCHCLRAARPGLLAPRRLPAVPDLVGGQPGGRGRRGGRGGVAVPAAGAAGHPPGRGHPAGGRGGGAGRARGGGRGRRRVWGRREWGG